MLTYLLRLRLKLRLRGDLRKENTSVKNKNGSTHHPVELYIISLILHWATSAEPFVYLVHENESLGIFPGKQLFESLAVNQVHEDGR